MSAHNDPYVYPQTNVLINKYNIRNAEVIQEIEGVITLLKSKEPLPVGNLDYDHLKAIHRHFFGDLYEWAGEERTVDIAKGNSYFAHTTHITRTLDKLFHQLKVENYLRELPLPTFCERLSYYFNEINAAHPFREGNGRTQRAFCDVLAQQAGYKLDWTQVNQVEYMKASIAGFSQGDYEAMSAIFKQITASLNQTLNATLDIHHLSAETKNLLKDYVEKQVQLNELVEQKNQHLAVDLVAAKVFGQQARELSAELKQTAKLLLEAPDVKPLINQLVLTTLQKQGGFATIHAHFKNNRFLTQDVLTVVRYAKSQTISLSQSLNQSQNKGRSREL